MSIKIMSLVWEKSKHHGSALLLMLALADHADDKGRCWPGMTSLGLKTRMGRRNVVRLMERLEKSGEVIVEVRGGQSASNRYRINVDLLGSDQLITSDHTDTTPSVQAITRVVSKRSHESSLTVSKPSRKPSAEKKADNNGLYPLAEAIATVCNIDLSKNRGMLFAEAKRLNESPQDVTDHYGPGAWWYKNDWRGKKGQPPKPSDIRLTWGQWQTNGATETSESILEFS